MTTLVTALFFTVTFLSFTAPLRLAAQTKAAAWQAEWDKTLEAAKQEGKVTISIPASAEMRKQIEANFKKCFGIDVEVFTSRGSAGVRRMADEFRAGVRHFDLHIGGSSSIVSDMLNEEILDPVEPWLVLPEVKDPSNGGAAICGWITPSATSTCSRPISPRVSGITPTWPTPPRCAPTTIF